MRKRVSVPEPDCEKDLPAERQPGAQHQETVDGYIGPRIQELLKKYHLTRYRLSQLSGVLPINISRYVMGVRTPSLQTLEKICAGFGITLSEFFDASGYQADPSFTKEQNELLKILDGLDEDRTKQLISYGNFLLHTQNRDT